MNRHDTKVRKMIIDPEKSRSEKYRSLVIGKSDLNSLLKYELITLLTSWIPGVLGLLLRSRLYPRLLGSVGRNVVFGTNIVLRHSHKIFIGDDVIIDDNVVLDAKGATNRGIFIGSKSYIGRNTILSCKDGDIILNQGVNVGFNCEIFSSSSVVVGSNTLIAAYCYLVGGGNYDITTTESALADQIGLESAGGILIGKDCWLAADVKVLDGVCIGSGAIIGAGSVVRDNTPADSIAAGVPAKFIRDRFSKQKGLVGG